jgi:Conserved TM helix
MVEGEETMREMIVGELTQAMQEIARGFAHLLPRVIVMLIIALIGWIIAYIAKWTLRSILRLAKFDKLSENAGASQLLSQAALPSFTELLSRLIFWIAWLGFILAGISVLGIGGLQEHINGFLLFLPRLFVASFIVFFGLLAASFFSRAALLASVNANLASPRLVSVCVRTVIIVFVLSMVFEELGLAEQTMLLAFGIAFGAVMFGLALAFGIGGKDLARAFLERKLVRDRKPKLDELSPL